MLTSLTNKALRFLSGKFGFAIHRTKNTIIFNAEFTNLSIPSRKSFALELAILKELESGWMTGAQIGAAGPVSADFLESLIIKYDLKILLVDGNEQSLHLKRDRLLKQGCSSVTSATAWISDKEEITRVYSFQTDDDELSGYISLDREQFTTQAEVLDLKDKVVSKEVLTVDIYNLLLSQLGKALSILVLDCEGMDLRILNRVINSDLHIKIIVFEALSISPDEIKALFSTLTDSSYLIYPDVSDVIAVKSLSLGRPYSA